MWILINLPNSVFISAFVHLLDPDPHPPCGLGFSRLSFHYADPGADSETWWSIILIRADQGPYHCKIKKSRGVQIRLLVWQYYNYILPQVETVEDKPSKAKSVKPASSPPVVSSPARVKTTTTSPKLK